GEVGQPAVCLCVRPPAGAMARSRCGAVTLRSRSSVRSSSRVETGRDTACTSCRPRTAGALAVTLALAEADELCAAAGAAAARPRSLRGWPVLGSVDLLDGLR